MKDGKMFKIGNRAAVISILASSTLMLAGCGGDASGDDDGDAAGAVAMSFPGRDIQIWNDMLPFMEDYLEERGYELITDNPDWDAQTQADTWESWIVGGEVDAIMGYPVQADSLAGVTAQANDFDIPVIGYSTEWEGTAAGLLMDHHSDGEQLGSAAAEWIEETHGDENVDVALLSYSDSDLGRLRMEGIRESLEAAELNLTFTEHPVNLMEEGYSAVQNQLTAFPDTKVWLAFSNDSARGAHQALIDAGVDADDDDILLGNIDGTDAELEIVAEPESFWRLLYMSPAREMAEASAQLLIDAAEDRDVENSVVEMTQVSGEGAEDYLLENQ